MKITLKGKDLQLTDSLYTYTDRKILTPLKKRLENSKGENAVTVDIELLRDTKHHKKGEVFRAEVNIMIPPKKMLHAEAKGEDIREAIDLLEEAIIRKLELYKGKTKLTDRRKARKRKNSGA